MALNFRCVFNNCNFVEMRSFDIFFSKELLSCPHSYQKSPTCAPINCGSIHFDLQVQSIEVPQLPKMVIASVVCFVGRWETSGSGCREYVAPVCVVCFVPGAPSVGDKYAGCVSVVCICCLIRWGWVRRGRRQGSQAKFQRAQLQGVNGECGETRTRVLSSLDHAILCSTTKQSASPFLEGPPRCGASPSSCLLVGLFSIIFSVCIMAFSYPFISTCLMLYFVSCIISCIILAVGWHKSRVITTQQVYYPPPGLSPGYEK